MNEEAKLLPCPFCGGPAMAFFYNGTHEATCSGDHECPGTDVCAPVAAWNTRTLTHAGEGDELVERKIHHPGYGKPYPVAVVLSDLASQENCDGEPYDQMMEASKYIRDLTDTITALRAEIAELERQSDDDGLDLAREQEAVSYQMRRAKAAEAEIAELRDEADKLRDQCHTFGMKEHLAEARVAELEEALWKIGNPDQRIPNEMDWIHSAQKLARAALSPSSVLED